MKSPILFLVLACGAFSQTTLNLSQDLARLGIAQSNMVPNQSSLDAGPLFFRGVMYAQAHQISRVIADPGAYYFLSQQFAGGPHVDWDQLHDLTIDLQGSDLYFAVPLASGIFISRSANIVLENFTADYNPLPFTQVRVVSVNGTQRQVQFAVDGAWQNPSVLNAVFSAVPAGSVEVHIFRSGRPIQGVPRMYAANPVGTNQFTILIQGAGNPSPATIGLIRPGDTAVLAMRTANAGPVSLANCTGCTVRNITTYSSVEWGIDNFEGDHCVYERTYSMPRPGTDRLVSTFGHLELGTTGSGNQIRLNRMIRTMDNGSPYAVDVIGAVQSRTDSRTLVLQGASTTLLQVGGLVPNGSNVAFQALADGSILGAAVIVSQNAPPFSPQGTYTVTYGFDRDLPPAVVGSLMYSLDEAYRGGNSVIERNAIEKDADCCRGYLIAGTLDTTVHGNYFRRAALASLHIENGLYGADSPPSTNLTISNNVIDQPIWTTTLFPEYQLGAIQIITAKPGNTPAAVPAHQNIQVTGNFIADSGSSALWMGNTNGGSATGNYYLRPNSNAAVESAVAVYGQSAPASFQGSQNIVMSNNVVDQTSGRVWITDAQYRELAAYAPGSAVRLNAYEIGTTFAAPGVTLTDADGVVRPAAILSSTAHSIDVQVPASAALGGAYVTVTAGTLTYFGTLFVDSQDNIPALNGCIYEMSPASPSTGSNANSVSVLVVTQSGCSYTVSATDAFTTGGAGTADTGVVSVGFADNSGTSRNTTIEIAGQPIGLTQAAPSTSRPAVQAIVDAWTYSSGLAPGEWVTITGTGLSGGPPRVWNLAGTQRLPPTLGGVVVTFNGTPATLYYVSPTQINALVPAAVAPGPVQVVVQANGVNSTPFSVTATVTQPSVYSLPAAGGGSFFVTAALAGTSTLIGNSAVDPRVLRAAGPGDTLDLYMIGLGSTADPASFVTDQLFAGAFPLTAPVNATIGGKPVPVEFAGLTSPGLYLVRITVPSGLAPGPQPIQVSAGGAKTPPSLAIMIGSQP